MTQLALVTGASSGLGKALCFALAKQGIPLILVARNEAQLKKVASDLSVPTQIHPADLTDAKQRKALVQRIHEQRPDLVINNAGFGLYGPALAHPLSDLQAMIELNVQALMELSVEAARALVNANQKGVICNISSAAAFFATPSFCLYSATKAFVNNFSQGLDAELKDQGVRVLTVCPGQIDTGFRKRASGGFPSGRFPQEKKGMTMPPEKAAALILKQIAKGKALCIIDWRTRLLVGLARLLPKEVAQTLIKKEVTNRQRF